MRRPYVTLTFTMALALAPAASFAQATATPPPAQPPAQAAPPAPAAPKIAFTTNAGILLIQINPDQTAVFEELVGKLKAGLAKTEDATLKQQAAGLKIYKANEPFGKNALYIMSVEPVVPNAEYELFAMLGKVMTPDELRAPDVGEMWKRYQGAFAAPLGRLNLNIVGGGH